MLMARALRDRVCRAGPQPPMDWSMVRLGARAGPTLDSGLAHCVCLHKGTSTELSLVGYVRKPKTHRTSGQLQRQVLTRGQIVHLAVVARRGRVGPAADVHGFLHSADPRTRRGTQTFQVCVRTSARVRKQPKRILKRIKFRTNLINLPGLDGCVKFQIRANFLNLAGLDRYASGHISASGHSELSVALRPPGGRHSLQNVMLLRRFRAIACKVLLNQFGNMVSLRKGFPRETGRVNLEDSPLFRPPHRQDNGSVAGGVSWIRPVVGISGSPHPAVKRPLGNMVWEHRFPRVPVGEPCMLQYASCLFSSHLQLL